MSNIIRATLDFFVAVSVLVAFGQDVYKLTYPPSSPSVAAVSQQSGSSSGSS